MDQFAQLLAWTVLFIPVFPGGQIVRNVKAVSPVYTGVAIFVF